MGKRIAIWVFGLLASGATGFVIALAVDRLNTGDSFLLGVLGGLSAFTCARLLLTTTFDARAWWRIAT